VNFANSPKILALVGLFSDLAYDRQNKVRFHWGLAKFCSDGCRRLPGTCGAPPRGPASPEWSTYYFRRQSWRARAAQFGSTGCACPGPHFCDSRDPHGSLAGADAPRLHRVPAPSPWTPMDVDAVAIGSFFAGPTFTVPPAAAVKAAQRSASHLSASPAWPAADTAARATIAPPWIRATSKWPPISRRGRAGVDEPRLSLGCKHKALCATCAARVGRTRLHWCQRRRELRGISRVHA